VSSEKLVDVLERVNKIEETVRDYAAESELLGQLAPPVVAAMHDGNLFRILVPAELGGDELTIPEAIEAFERVATFDASTAWTLAILSGGPLFGRFLESAAFAEICGDPRGQMAGTLNPTGRAAPVDGGYVFSGRATYLSGSAHAKWVMASAIVERPDAFEIRLGVFPIERARSLDTWHVAGMRATGSTDYEFENVEVEDGWTFNPFDPRPQTREPYASIPLWAQLGGVLAACAVGAARNMIDRFYELAMTKIPAGGNFTRLAERAPAQIAFGEANGLYEAARSVLHDAVDSVWDLGVAKASFTNEVLARQRVSIVASVRLAARAIDLLHDAAGMSAIRSDSVLDRCWRDVHTMTQHIILSPARYEIAGRVLLGLDPGAPVI
jgi:alkylation response protein AidB-like acyl-CoA dehydrogenase